MTTETNTIRTENVLRCPLCGEEEHKVVYTGLRDRVYGAPGEWTLKECKHCGLLFQAPRPTVEDIGKVYATYYTHSVKKKPRTLSQRLREYIRGGYLASAFGYMEGIAPLQRLLGRLAHLHPEEREIIRGSVMYLPAKHRGHMLDVGPGSGETMKELRRLGWKVEGVDFDAEAVRVARRSYDLDVKLGTLEEQSYPSNHFDAVIVSHVIEHLHDVLAFLAECQRILRPGGRLVAITPNINSLGHRLFKASWLPLDPPRHLLLFSPETLTSAAHQAGFSQAEVKTTVRGAYGISIESDRISKSQPNVGEPPGSMLEKLRGHLYQYAESFALLIEPDLGEELLIVAIKD
jgi:2-polyprenyl-3-methyl-5-hydroxy-6-metoxy-1,4-benzoquinol methylase